LIACGGKPCHFRSGYGQFIEVARWNLQNIRVQYRLKKYRTPGQWPTDDLFDKPHLLRYSHTAAFRSTIHSR
jgi:hypothetical protein